MSLKTTTLALAFGLLASAPFAFANQSGPAQSSAQSKLAPAASPSAAPAAAPDQAGPPNANCPGGRCGFMPQSTAFESAAEQSAFMGLYQSSFGPFGHTSQSKGDRKELLRETAIAIDDCLNKRDCNTDKQEKVVKALVHFNMGQEVRRMMITNNTNANNIRSIDDNSLNAAGKPRLNQDAVMSSLQTGTKFDYTSGGLKREARANRGEAFQNRTKEKTTIGRSDGDGKEGEYFQLSESGISRGINAKYLNEREILGEQFLKDYHADLDKLANTDQSNEDRFRKYKKVVARESYVFQEDKDKKEIDEQRFREIQAEQQNPEIRKALTDFKASLTGPTGQKNAKTGQVDGDASGLKFDKIGLEPARLPASFEIPGVNTDDLKKDGKVDSDRIAVRAVNKAFKDAAEKQKLEEQAKKGNLRSAEGFNRKERAPYTTAFLDPHKFGDFLDEIWPKSAARQARINEP